MPPCVNSEKSPFPPSGCDMSGTCGSFLLLEPTSAPTPGDLLSPPSPTRHPGEPVLQGFWRVAAPVEHEASVWKLPQIHSQSQIPSRSISHSVPEVLSADLPARSCWHCLGFLTSYTGLLLLQPNNSVCFWLPLDWEDLLEKG